MKKKTEKTSIFDHFVATEQEVHGPVPLRSAVSSIRWPANMPMTAVIGIKLSEIQN